MKKTQNFTEGKIFSPLIRFALPVLLVLFLQTMYGAFGVRLPVSWIMNKQDEVSLFHIGLATPTSTVVQIILCGVYFVITLRKAKRIIN